MGHTQSCCKPYFDFDYDDQRYRHDDIQLNMHGKSQQRRISEIANRQKENSCESSIKLNVKQNPKKKSLKVVSSVNSKKKLRILQDTMELDGLHQVDLQSQFKSGTSATETKNLVLTPQSSQLTSKYGSGKPPLFSCKRPRRTHRVKQKSCNEQDFSQQTGGAPIMKITAGHHSRGHTC